VSESLVAAEVYRRARATGHDVVVLPLRRDGDVAVYTEASVTVVKELRALGVSASFLDPTDQRAFEVKKGALATGVVTLLLGIASNAGWTGIQQLLRKRTKSPLSVTYIDLTSEAAHVQAWRVDGQDSEVILQAIEKLRNSSDNP
jgi:hypothetical protein